MRKLIGIGFLLILFISTVFAQEQLSIKQQADKAYDRYEYFKGLNLYLKIANKGKAPLQVTERIADCYRNMNNDTAAELWYAKAIINPKAGKAIHFYYAGVLQRSGKLEEARSQYKIGLDGYKNILALELADCDSAKAWMDKPTGYMVKNVKSINSPFSDWGANFDGQTDLIFTSDRVIDENVDNRTGNNWFKLYSYDIKGDNVSPVAVSSAISDAFNGNYHIGPIVLNNTGDTAYITLTTEIAKKRLDADKKDWQTNQKLFSRRLQLVVAKKENGQWVIISTFPYNNIQKYSVSSAALSKNGKLLYFSSDMPGGEGKTDIWYCEKQADGTWGTPLNCGPNINTPEEDDFPYLDDNGTLYYASKGLPGMGGYDIYSAKGEKANWSTPKNLKYPANTTSDDFYFATRDGLNGYLSSNRNGGAGSDDIYSFSCSPADTITPKHITPNTVAQNTPVVNRDIPKVAKVDFTFEPVYYDLDRSNIRADAAVILNKMADSLIKYPNLKIEIASYTDARASIKYNIALSKRRAGAVVKYLKAKGINGSRLVAKWHGKTNLVNDCGDNIKCTEAEHQLNRRSEFKIIAE